MSSKKRKSSDEYVQYGFTCITERDGSQRPQCMICNAKLSNSSLAPAKLREHFLKLHGDGKYMNTTLAEFKVKRARFDEKATLPVFGFVPIDKPVLTASYKVAYLIAKQGKPHTIGETLIKPAALKMANIMLGKAAENKLSQIPLSNDTISSRIDDMSNDILAQVVADLISSPAKFSLQLDETTDVSSLCQIAVFVRYVKDDMIKEDFLFCRPLTTTTKAADVKKLVDDFFRDNNLHGIWFLQHALATKTLPPKLAEVLKIVVECVNYVRNSALKHHIFKELCNEMGSEFEVLLYHSNIRWLSRGKVLNCVFAMRVEFALFLREHKHCHADYFENSEFILILAYMADIFDALNHLNQQMQGGGVNIIEAEENLKAFQKKLPLWKRRTENDNFANFPLLDDCVSKIEDVSGIGDISVPRELKQAIAMHLDELAKSLDGYFPTRESYHKALEAVTHSLHGPNKPPRRRRYPAANGSVSGLSTEFAVFKNQQHTVCSGTSTVAPTLSPASGAQQGQGESAVCQHSLCNPPKKKDNAAGQCATAAAPTPRIDTPDKPVKGATRQPWSP
ncbi:protein ZBED8-like [Portunus trituberculatus]|uniref:protein ZBED8-like n=1 Tax=Portunus trituberculatus TaxID=210409 RepID=UPI001E1CDABD|nr:protein ZBED8-like [Portunus trituberculatus]